MAIFVYQTIVTQRQLSDYNFDPTPVEMQATGKAGKEKWDGNGNEKQEFAQRAA